MTSYLLPTYQRQPISFQKGQGSWLYDQQNTAYLDALTGIAVCGLGHCHPKISQAIADQASTLVHTSNLFVIDWQEKAAEKLCQAAGMDKVFFANSGAEANEAALKLARLYAHQMGLKRPKVIVMEKSFHGRTLLTVSATANPKARAGFFTLDEDFIRVPFGDVHAIQQAIDHHDHICAIMLEPIQGEGGVNTADQGFQFLDEVRQICDKFNLLMILDEVQTGNARTGKYFAYQHSQSKPDILTTAKGLGNGFPVGACLTSGKANEIFSYGSHGSTYGGTPLACRVVHEVIDIIHDENILQQVQKRSDFLINNLTAELKDFSIQIRGAGLMLGLVLPTDHKMDLANLVKTAQEQHHLITNLTGERVIRLLPPLNMSDDETNLLIDKLVKLIKQTIV